MDKDEKLRIALRGLQQRFAANAEATLAEYAALADRLREAPGDREPIEALARQLHRLRGTAGSYGFHSASALAARFETTVQAWLDEPPQDALANAAAREVATRAFIAELAPLLQLQPNTIE
ncbi:MAG: Hpt domain-containing protein [Gemmatimonadaceae bacterium]|nr:Hpt domain-containing protein [Gemmatimonadaceae bacterium]